MFHLHTWSMWTNHYIFNVLFWQEKTCKTCGKTKSRIV